MKLILDIYSFFLLFDTWLAWQRLEKRFLPVTDDEDDEDGDWGGFGF